MDEQANKAVFSIGFQLAPVLGLGFSPILPFGYKIDPKRIDKTDQSNFADKFGLPGQIISGVFNIGGNITYEKDSPIINNIEFIGLAALASAYNRPVTRVGRALIDKLPRGVQADLYLLGKQTKSIRKYTSGAMNLSRSMAEGITVLPFVAAHGTAQAVTKVFGKMASNNIFKKVLTGFIAYSVASVMSGVPENEETDVKSQIQKMIPAGIGIAAIVSVNKVLSLSPINSSRFIRTALPFYLAASLGRLMSDNDSGYTQKKFSPYEQFNAFIGSGLIFGGLLHSSGAFARTDDITDTLLFKYSSKKRNKVLREVMSELEPEKIISVTKHLGKLMPTKGFKRIKADDNLLKSLSLETLVQRTSLYESKEVTEGVLRHGKIKAFTARLRSAGKAYATLTLGSSLIANLLNDSQLESLYKVPIIGQVVRLFSGVDPSNNISGKKRTNRLQSFVSKVLKTATLGILDFDKATGAYQDKSDPFLAVFGGLGASFREGGRTTEYFQVASPFSDLSFSSYKIGKMAASGSITNMEVLAKGTPAGLNANQALRLRIARLRGATPRKDKMQIDKVLSEYALESLTSSGIKRSINVQNFLVKNLAQQRPSEIGLDMYREGLVTGSVSSKVMKGSRLKRIFDPLSTLKGSFTTNSKRPETKDATISTIDDWAETGLWKEKMVNSEVLRGLTNPLTIANKLNFPAAYIPVAALVIGSTALALMESFSSLANIGAKQSLIDLANDSKIFNSRPVTNKKKFVFTSFIEAATNKMSVIQIDLTKLDNVGYVFGLDADNALSELVESNSPRKLASTVSNAYSKHLGSVNRFFKDNFSAELNKNLVESFNPNVFKNNVREQLTTNLSKSFNRTSIKTARGRVSYYDSVFGGNSKINPSLDKYVTYLMDGSEEFQGITSAIDEVLEYAKESYKGNAPVGSEMFVKRRVELLDVFEKTTGFKSFVETIERPLTGEYNLSTNEIENIKSFKSGTEINEASYKSIKEARNSMKLVNEADYAVNSNKSKIYRFGLESNVSWSQKGIGSVLDAGKGASILLGQYVEKIVPAYEIIEGASLALDKSKPDYLRQSGGESAIRSFVTTAISVGISAGLTFLGLPAFASLAIGVTSMMGFQLLTGMNKTLRDSQDNFVKGFSNLVFKPVKTIAKVFKPLGLDNAFETVAGTILAPFGGAISLMAKAINSFTSSVTGPLLAEMIQGMDKASPWQQMLGQIFLPQTAYTAEANSRFSKRATLVNTIKQSTKIGGIPELYSEINGGAYYDSSRHFIDDATKNKVYGQSYAGGGRILSSFLSTGIRMSNIMRMSLERKRFLSDHFVVGSAITRMNTPHEPNISGMMGMSGLLLAFANKKRIFKALGKVGTAGISRFDSVMKSSMGISPKAFIDKAINLKTLAQEVLVTKKPKFIPDSFKGGHLGHKVAYKFNNFLEGIKFNLKASVESLFQKSKVLSYSANTVEVATEASKNFERLSGQLFGSAKGMAQVNAPKGFSTYASLEQSGMYNIKKNAIRLSSTTEYGLGSSFVNKVFKSKSEFIALHELGHSYDSLTGVRLGLGNINSIGNQGRLNNKQIREVVRGMARDSVIQYASGNKLSKKLISKIYRDEVSASTRALVQMNSNNSEDLGLLLNKLAQEGKVSNIKEFKQLVKNTSSENVKDSGIRFLQKKLNITVGPELKGLMKSAGTVKEKLFASVSYKKFLGNSNVKNTFLNRSKSHIGDFSSSLLKEQFNDLLSKPTKNQHIFVTAIDKAFRASVVAGSGTVVGKDLIKGSLIEGTKDVYSMINKPLINTTRNLNARLGRLGLNLFDVLDVGFTGLDLMLGQESVNQARNVNKDLSVLYRQSGARGLVSNRTSIMKSLEDSKSNQLGALTGNLFGVSGSLLSPNPIYGLVGGAAATAFGLIGFGGLNKYLANRDYERALQGHGTYDPIQSQGLYLRSHRGFEQANAVGNALFEAPRSFMGKQLTKVAKFGKKHVLPILSKVGKVFDSLLNVGLTGVTGGVMAAIGTSIISTIGSATLLAVKSGKAISRSIKNISKLSNFKLPDFGNFKLPKFNMSLLSKLSNIKNIKIPNILKNFKLPSINFSNFKIPGIDFSKLKIPNINFGNIKLKLPKINLDFLKNIKMPSLDKLRSFKLPDFNIFKNIKLPGFDKLKNFKLPKMSGGKLGQFIKNAPGKLFSIYKDFFSTNISFNKLKNVNFKGLVDKDNLKYQYWLWSNTTKSGRGVKSSLDKAGRVLSSAKFKLEDAAASLMNPNTYKSIKDAAINSMFTINSKAGKAFNSLKYSLSRGVSKVRNFNRSMNFGFVNKATSRLKSGVNKVSSSLKNAYTVASTVLRNSTNIDNYRYQYWLWANTSKSSKLLTKAGSTINDLFTNGMDLVGKSINRIKPGGVFKTVKSIGTKLATSLKDLSSRLPKFNLSSAVDKASMLGKKLLTGATKVVSSSFGSLASRSLSFASKLYKPILNFGIRAETAAIKKINRFVPSIGRTLAIKGFKETLIDAISPLIDITTFGSGVLEISQLNKKSTLADVEQAYAKASGAKGSLVGSILGFTAGGGFGDFIGSLAGNLIGSSFNKAKLRFDTKDFGAATILEDQVKPLIRDSALAYQVGKNVSTKLVKPLTGMYLSSLRQKAGLQTLAKSAQGSRALLNKGINPNQFKLARHEKLILNINNSGKSAFAKQVAKASTRLKSVGGTAGQRVISKTLQAGGKIGKTAVKAFSLLSPVIDTYLIGSGYNKLRNAETQAEFVSGNRRMMGSSGSLAGAVIGGSLLGPIGAIAGSLIGDFAGNMYGEYIGKEAHRKRLSGKDLANNQLGGGIIGGVLVGAGAVGLAALGVISAPLILAGVAIGALAGAAIGGYNYVKNNNKEKLTKSIYEKPKQKEFKDSVRIESTQQTPVKPLSQNNSKTSKGFFTPLLEYVFGSPAQASELNTIKNIQQKTTDRKASYKELIPVKSSYKKVFKSESKKQKNAADSIGNFLTKITNSAVKFFLKAKDALMNLVQAGSDAASNVIQGGVNLVTGVADTALDIASGGSVGAGRIPILSGEYSSLNKLIPQLASNKYFKTDTEDGRSRMVIAVSIGATEAFGAGQTGTDFFTRRGGTGNNMKGLAQYNLAYHSSFIDTPEKYKDYLGQHLSGERVLPNSQSAGNPGKRLSDAIKSGEVKSGPDLERFLRKIQLGGSNWQGLDDGWKRNPGLSNQLFNYLKSPPAPSIVRNDKVSNTASGSSVASGVSKGPLFGYASPSATQNWSQVLNGSVTPGQSLKASRGGGSRLHNGIDFDGTEGLSSNDLVNVMFPGSVVTTAAWGAGGYADQGGGRSNAIQIKSALPGGGSFYMDYGHMKESTFKVKTGSQVAAGQNLARLSVNDEASQGGHLDLKLQVPTSFANKQGFSQGSRGKVEGYTYVDVKQFMSWYQKQVDAKPVVSTSVPNALVKTQGNISANVVANKVGSKKTATVAQSGNVAPASGTVKTTKAPTVSNARVITATPYDVISFSGQTNNSGVRGNFVVKKYEDVSPHWNGSGGYTTYKRDSRFKTGWKSMVGDLQVSDLALYRNDNENVEVRAAASGTVVSAGGSYGLVGIKTSSGEVVRMLHNTGITVAVGQKVQFGQIVGRQGDAGTGNGAYHVHLEASDATTKRYVEALVSGTYKDTDIGAGSINPDGTSIVSGGSSGTKAMEENTNSSLGSRIVRSITGFLKGFMVFNVFKAVAALGNFAANKVMLTNGASGANRVKKRGERPMRELLNAWGAYAPARQESSLNNGSPSIVNRTSQTAQQTVPLTTQVPNMPGASDDQRWAIRTIQAAQRIGVSPKDLMAVMYFESDWIPNNSNNVNPNNRDASGAAGHIGLIQFGPDYRRTKGISKAQIGKMDRVQQMDLVEDYLLNYVANGRRDVYQKGGVKALYGAILAGDASGRFNDSKDEYGTSVNNAVGRMNSKVGNKADILLNSVGYNSKTGTFNVPKAPKPPAAEQVKRVVKSDGKQAQAEINKIVAFTLTDTPQAINVLNQLTTSFETAMVSVNTKKQLTGAIKVIIPDVEQIALADTAVNGVMNTEVNTNVIDNNGRIKINFNKEAGYIASNWKQITGADSISEYQNMETGLTENA